MLRSVAEEGESLEKSKTGVTSLVNNPIVLCPKLRDLPSFSSCNRLQEEKLGFSLCFSSKLSGQIYIYEFIDHNIPTFTIKLYSL